NGSSFRPWFSQSADPAGAGTTAGKIAGALRFLGTPGVDYQFRLTVRDAARNPAAPVVLNAPVPSGGGPPATAAAAALLGPLPSQPDGAAPVAGLRQEHPSADGALVLGNDASLGGFGGDAPPVLAAPA